jgi:lambda family phage tail tape measure protein
MAENRVQVIISGENDTKGVFDQVESSLKNLEKVAEGAMKVLEGLALIEAGRKLVEFAEHTLEAEANLAKMSQRTGVAVDQLSELTYAANLSGLSAEQLEKGIKKLQTTLSNAAAGNQQAASSLASVGVNARDSQGKVLGAADALEKIAAKFAATKDGSDKAALAVQIFGRAGTQLIPLLDKGQEGIAKFREEAKKLGIVLSEEDAAAAEQLEQNIKRLEAAGQGLMQHFLGGLAPELNKIADAILGDVDGFDAAKSAGEGLGVVIKILYESFAALVTIAGITEQKMLLIAEAAIDISDADLGNAAENLKKFFGAAEDGATDELLQKFGKLHDTLWGDGTKESRSNPTADLERQADEADAIRKAKQKAEIDAAKGTATYLETLNNQELAALKTLYDHELISVKEYFDKKKRLQMDNLDFAIQALQTELAVEQGAAKSATKEQDKIAALSKIDDLMRSIGLKQAELLRMQGKVSGTEDPGAKLKNQADAMERYAAEATRMQEQIDHVYSKLAADIALVETAEKNRTVTTTAGDKKINELNAQARADLQGLVFNYEELAAASGDKKLIDNAEKLKQKYEELAHTLNWLRDTAVDSLDSDLENLFVNLSDNSKSAAQDFKDFALSIISDIDKMIAKMFAMYLIEKLLGFIGGLFGGGALGGSGGGAGLDTFASGFDSTGIVPFHALGGRMNAGEAGIVGDAGAELFVPDVAGTVVPNNQLGGFLKNAAQGDNYYIDARGADAGVEQRVMRALMQVKAMP